MAASRFAQTHTAIPLPGSPRWKGIQRPYTDADVEKVRGSLRVEHTLADHGARLLWDLMHSEDYVHALGALTGNQAMQQVRAGLKAIYVSGWQVAADANVSGQMYPDQSLYPANSVPHVVRRINQALQRADQIEHAEHMALVEKNGNGSAPRNWFAPIIADAEAGFGGPLNVFELMKGMIEAGLDRFGLPVGEIEHIGSHVEHRRGSGGSGVDRSEQPLTRRLDCLRQTPHGDLGRIVTVRGDGLVKLLSIGG